MGKFWSHIQITNSISPFLCVAQKHMVILIFPAIPFVWPIIINIFQENYFSCTKSYDKNSHSQIDELVGYKINQLAMLFNKTKLSMLHGIFFHVIGMGTYCMGQNALLTLQSSWSLRMTTKEIPGISFSEDCKSNKQRMITPVFSPVLPF